MNTFSLYLIMFVLGVSVTVLVLEVINWWYEKGRK